MASHSPPPPLPENSHPLWEVLLLISPHLDPKTLAMASCVCKTWYSAMSQDQLWKPLCLTHYPSLSSLQLIQPSLPYHLLFSLGYRASKHHRPNPPSQPQISLQDLIFMVDVLCDDARVFSIVKGGEDLEKGGLFQFDVFFGDDFEGGRLEKKRAAKVAWSIVLKGWKGAFFVMDGTGNGKLIGGNERWFSEELPPPGCCPVAVTSGLVAELRLNFCGGEDGKSVMVKKLSLGLMSVLSWRYVSLDDGLRYLQHFLLP